jgi:iron complex transport system ATP-binding protein
VTAVIRISKASKWLGDKLALDGVDWEVLEGQHWVILGLNGSGKTTLLRIATGHMWPSSGKASLLGHEFGSVDLRRLRRSVGWVTSALAVRMPQGQKAVDVVLSGRFDSIGIYDDLSPQDEEKAHRLLGFLEAEETAQRPFGVLSQGEQQRVLIARAMMPDPRLLVLDEPCVGLDLKAREAFLRTVGKLTASTPSVIYVTHHIEEIMPQFTHALLLKDGRVSGSGPMDETLNSRNLTTAFGMDLEVAEDAGRYYVRL